MVLRFSLAVISCPKVPCPWLTLTFHLKISIPLAEDLEAVASAWREAGVSQLVHSCVEPGEFPAMQAIADRCPEVYLSIGLHPPGYG